MVEVELRIFSNHREGLMIQLGRIISAQGFTMLRPRMRGGGQDVVLTVMVRGPDQNLSALQGEIAKHPYVQHLETGEGGSGGLTDSGAARTDAPPSTPSTAASESRAEDAGAIADMREIESLLESLASSYPRSLNHAVAFDRSLPTEQRAATLAYAGKRLGAWVYKRDFALGARLSLADSIKNIALPALRQMLKGVTLDGSVVHIPNSPFCGLDNTHEPACHFFRGYIEGLLNESGHLGQIRIVESGCRNSGADTCTFTPTAG